MPLAQTFSATLLLALTVFGYFQMLPPNFVVRGTKRWDSTLRLCLLHPRPSTHRRW